MWLGSNRKPRVKRISQGQAPGTRRFCPASLTPSIDTGARARAKLSPGESLGDKVTQVDTGKYSTDCVWWCFLLITTVLYFHFHIPKLINKLHLSGDRFFYKFSQQPVQTVAPKSTGPDWHSVDVKRAPPPSNRVLFVWASLEQGFSVAKGQRQWRRKKAPLWRVTPLIKVRLLPLLHSLSKGEMFLLFHLTVLYKIYEDRIGGYPQTLTLHISDEK